MKRLKFKNKRSWYSIPIFSAAIASCGTSQLAKANTANTIINGGSFVLDNSANWSLGTLPTSTTDVVVATGYPLTNTNYNFSLGSASNTSGSVTYGTINDTANNAAYYDYFQGGGSNTSTYSLTLAGGVNSVAPATNDLIYASSNSFIGFHAGGGTALYGTLTLSFGQSGNIDAVGGIYIASNISAGSTSMVLNKTGTGLLELNIGTAGYKGTYNLSAGTLEIAGGGSLGTAQANVPELTFTGNSTLDLGATTGVGSTRIFAINNGVTATIDTLGLNVSIGSPIINGTNGSGGSLIKIDSGVLTMTGSSNYSGSTTVTGGTLLYTNTNNYGGATNISGGILQLNANGSIPSTTTLNFGSTGTAGTFLISGTHNFNQSVAAVNLIGGNAFISATSFNTSNLSLALGNLNRSVGAFVDFTVPTGLTGSVGSVTITNANANFSGGSPTILAGYATANNQSTWAVSAGTGAIQGAISALTSYDTSFNVSGANLDVVSPDGGTTLSIASGTGVASVNSIRFNTSQALTLTVPTNFAVATGGILVTPNVGANASTITGGSITSNNGQDLIVIQNNNASTFTIASNIADSTLGSIGLTKTGIGSLTLTGTNTFTGTTNIVGGNIVLGSQNALENSTVNVSGGTIQFAQGIGNFVIGGISGPSTIVAANNILLNDTSGNQISSLTFGSNNQSTNFYNAFNSNGSGSTILVKTGTGTTYLGSGSSNFSGGMNITAGTLDFAFGSSFGATNNTITIFNGASVFYHQAGAATFGGNRSFTLNGGYDTIEIGSITTATNTSTSSLTLGTSGGTGTLLQGSGSPTATLVKTGLGTLILSNNATYNGGTNMAEGTLSVLASNALGVSTVPGDSGSGPLAIVPTSLFATVNFQTSAAVSSLTNYINGNASGGVASIVLGTPTGGSATLTIGSDGTSTIYSGGISDLTTSSSGATGSIIKVGTGALTLSGVDKYTGGTTVNAGSLILGSSTAFPAGSNLTIASGATVVAAQSSTGIYGLQMNTLSNSGLLDLTKNAAVIHSGTSIATAFSAVASGFNGGAWNGTTGITSSSAATDTTHLTAVGVIINDTTANAPAGNLSGQPLYTSVDGATTADGDILVKTTYYGDANLNGRVDGSDYSLIDNGFINNLTGWYNGDFNYDGVVNGSDYTLIDNAFNSQGASLASLIASPSAIATAQIAGSSAAVPEPTTLGIVAFGTLGLLGTRRRRK